MSIKYLNFKYRDLIPSLSREEYEQLEANILANGCLDPIKINKDRIILDGHNRYLICKEHKKEWKEQVLELGDENDEKIWILRNQAGRRNLSTGQKSAMALDLKKVLAIQAKTKEKERKTTSALVPKSELPVIDAWEDAAKTYNVSATTMKQHAQVIEKSPEKAKEIREGKTTIKKALKEIRKEELAVERKKIADEGSKVKESDKWHIYEGDIRTWKTDRKYDFIITDPPYVKEFIPLYETLGKRAKEWLKPGGLLIAMVGQTYLEECIKLLSKNMTYYWCGAYMTPGTPTQLRQKQVNCNWKPLLIYSLDGNYKGRIFQDVYTSEANDKTFHKWGQSESGCLSVVSRICIPGQSILDPFCGGGSFGVAALKLDCLFDGLDIDKDNCNISRRRLNDQTKK